MLLVCLNQVSPPSVVWTITPVSPTAHPLRLSVKIISKRYEEVLKQP